MPVQHAVFDPRLPLPDVTADGAWSPHIDVRELPDEYIVLADLPGVEPEAVHVKPEEDRLTIEGTRRDRLHAGGVPYWLERPTGKLRRSLLLPGPYDRTKIRTNIRDGVLEVRIPKRDDVGLTTEFRVAEAAARPLERPRSHGSAHPPANAVSSRRGRAGTPRTSRGHPPSLCECRTTPLGASRA